MRDWLFYKRLSDTEIEFRRVGGGCLEPHLGVVAPLNQICVFHGGRPTEKQIEQFVRQAKWVGEPPREYSHPVAQAILQGRW